MIPRKKRKQHTVIQLEDTLISSELKDEMFACDIARCKGACCVEGDLGAPVEKKELAILDDIYETIKPYLREEGIRAIEKQGTVVRDFTGNFSTPLVNGRECAYATFDEKGVALCGIEEAYNDGKIPFKKPISCHLYPVRVKQYRDLESLVYDRWDICSPACVKGKVNGVKVYEFVKDALIRKYGETWYNALDKVIKDRWKDG